MVSFAAVWSFASTNTEIDPQRANPVLFNDSLESSVLPRTRYHIHESSRLPRIRLLNAQELTPTVCSFIKQTILYAYRTLVHRTHSMTDLLSVPLLNKRYLVPIMCSLTKQARAVPYRVPT